MAFPTVVICIPTYNAETFIERTLLAVQRQTYPSLRILISDDASTDNTATICERFAAVDRRITVIRQKENLGWVGNCAALIDAVDATYFSFVGHDDVPSAQFVSKLVETLESKKEAILSYPDVRMIAPGKPDSIFSLPEVSELKHPLERALVIARRKSGFWLPSHGLFRTSAAKAVGGPRRHLLGTISADWPWVLRLALSGEFAYVQDVLLEKHRMSGSESGSWKRNRIAFAAVTLSCARVALNADLKKLDRLRLLRELIRSFPTKADLYAWKMIFHRRRKEAMRKIKKCVPPSEAVILIDGNQWQLRDDVPCQVLPFIEKGGEYWGEPESSDAAISELQRMHAAGAGFVAICWPSFWWFTQYKGFVNHLHAEGHCVLKNRSVVIFRLDQTISRSDETAGQVPTPATSTSSNIAS